MASKKKETNHKSTSVSEEFNKLNLSYRVCYKPTKQKDNEALCFCNRPIDSHQHKELPAIESSKWSVEHNTRQEFHPAHGALQNGSMYAQLAIDTPVERVEKLLFDVWGIKIPRLIMSVLGGTKYFNMSDRLESGFINGIIEVAVKSDACIVTNGYNSGIVQLVGQAITKMKLTNQAKDLAAIGIGKWGSISKSLEKNLPKVYERVSSLAIKGVDVNDSSDGQQYQKGELGLELNHTHFLMLDDGTIRHFDTKDYRTRLCAHLGRIDAEIADPIPVVTVVLEGGKDTIANIYYDLRVNIPVVIIDGTGRAADLMKRWYLHTREFDHHPMKEKDPVAISHIKLTLDNDDVQPFRERGNPKHDKQMERFQTQYDLTREGATKLNDLFSKYIKQLEEDIKANIYNHEESKKPSSIGDTNGKDDEHQKQIRDICSHVIYCLQPAVRSRLSFFNTETDNDLPGTIFRSICLSRQALVDRREKQQETYEARIGRSSEPPPTTTGLHLQEKSRDKRRKGDRQVEHTKLLELAMDWDCIDVAKELILKNSLDNIMNHGENFRIALQKNRPAFVYEFLKLGFNPVEAFEHPYSRTNRYTLFLQTLYKENQASYADTQLDEFIQRTQAGSGKEVIDTAHLNRILSELIGDYMHRLYFNTREEEAQYVAKKNLTRVAPTTEDNEKNGKSALKNNNEFITETDIIMRDLFLWAVLMNYIDMAKNLLAHMKYRICSALIATKILKAYHHHASHGKLKEKYIEGAKYFEQYAIECITLCEKSDPEDACKMVLQRNELYGYVTCLQVASHADDKDFLSHPCCVQTMNNAWYDKLWPEQTRKRDVLGLIAGVLSFGVLAPPFVTYRKEKIEQGMVWAPELRSSGVNYCDQYRLSHPSYSGVPWINKYLHGFVNFHHSLLMKFCYHCIFYIFFLLLFSYVLLFKFNIPTSESPSIDWTEILTIIFVSFMLIEEIHHFTGQDNKSIGGKFASYFKNLFKLMTALGFVLFYIGVILRFTQIKSEDDFTAARVVMAIDLEIWWLRSLSFIIVVPFLGPHLVAIAKMLKDLLFFMCIIAVVMAGYGIASRSMVYYSHPDIFGNTNTTTTFEGRPMFRQILYPVYYLMYGDMGNERVDLDQYPDAGWSIATQVLLAFHMLFVNILLTNLLIAMFSKRFDQVYDETRKIWHSQQFLFTREYFIRSPFFPPISWVYDFYWVIRKLIFFMKTTCCKGTDDRKRRVFRMIPKSDKDLIKWCQLEGASTYEYAHEQVRGEGTTGAKSNKGSGDGKDEGKEASGGGWDASEMTNLLKQLQEEMMIIKEYMKERASKP